MVGGWLGAGGGGVCQGEMHRGPAERKSIFGKQGSGNKAHDVEIVHFSFLEVAVTASRVMEGVKGVSPVV